MNQHSKILKNLIYLNYLLLNFLDPLLSFFNNGFIEYNLIQQCDLLSARNVIDTEVALFYISKKEGNFYTL